MTNQRKKKKKKPEILVEIKDTVNAVGAKKRTTAEVHEIYTECVTLYLCSHRFQSSVEDEIFVAFFPVIRH